MYATLAELESQAKGQQWRKRSSLARKPLEWIDWRSYALFRNAQLLRSANNSQRVIKLLHESLHRDPDFLPAKMNLLTLEMQGREGQVEKSARQHFYESTESSYKELLQSLPEEASGSDQIKIARAKLLYNMFAATDYTRGWKQTPTKPQIEPGLFKKFDDIVNAARSDSAGTDLRGMAQSLAILRVIIMLQFNTSGSNEDEASAKDEYWKFADSGVNAPQVFGAHALYSMACLSVAVGWSKTGSEKVTWFNIALDYLVRAKEVEHDLVIERAKTDASLTPLREDPKFRTLWDSFMEKKQAEHWAIRVWRRWLK